MPVFRSLDSNNIYSSELSYKLENIKTFLRWIHLLSILSKWRHNRGVIFRLYGPNFTIILSEALRSLVTEINGVMISWTRMQDNRNLPDTALVSLTYALLSAAIGLGQIVTRFACSDQDSSVYDIAVGSVPSQPWEVKDFTQRGLGLFLRSSNSSGKISPTEDSDRSQMRSESPMPVSPNRSSSGRVASNIAVESKNTDRANGETVHVLVSMLWKLHDFAHVLVCYVLEGEADPSGLKGLRSLLLVFQSQVLHSLSTFLAVHPVLVKNFRTTEGPGLVQSLLALSDVQPGQPTSALDSELLMQRFMLVLHCQDAGMDANVKTSKNSSVPVSDLERTIANLKPIFLWLSRRCDEEAAATVNLISEKTASKLTVECKCPQILRTKLPNTDLYPWDIGTSASAMHCGNMTTRQESSCSPLTNVFKTYWTKRRDSFPTDGVQVFEPSKTLLFTLAGNESEYGIANLSAINTQQAEIPFFMEHLSLPSARMMNHLLSKIFLVAWKYTRTTYSLSDKMIYVKTALRMLSDAVETAISTSSSMVFLIYYMLFIGRCIRYSPQQMILVCRSQRVWKLLLKLGGITSNRNAHLLSPDFCGKFMTVSSTLAGSDEIAPENAPIDDLVYHVMWKYNPHGGAHTPITAANTVPFSPARGIPAADSQDSHEPHVDADQLVDASLDASELSSGSRAVSVDSTQSPGVFSRKHLNSLDASFNSAFTNEGSEMESPRNIKQQVPFDMAEYTTTTTGGLVSKASEKDEFLLFFSQYVLKDMVMELIRICSHFSFLVHALMDTSVDSYLFLEYEANELTEALTAETTDDSIILIIRWLSDLADFHNQIFIQSSIWTNATKKCIALSKSLLDSLNSFVASTASYSGDILQARPLFWPARAATVQLISKIIYSPCSKDWLDAFLPKLEDAPVSVPNTPTSAAPSSSDTPERRTMSESIARVMLGARKATVLATNPAENAAASSAVSAPQSLAPSPNISRPVRHSVIIRLILDPLCRDFAVSIIAKILQTCAEVLHGYPAESVSATKVTKPSMIEALAHDVIKGLLNTLIAAPQQPEVNDGVGAVVLSLQALIVLLRNPSSLSGGREQNFPLVAYQRIFTNYGTLTPSHALLGWNYSRYNIFRDLLASLNASFKRSVSWNNAQKRKIMHYSLALMTAVMAENEAHKDTFWQLLMQKTKKKSSNMMMATNATHSHSYHDLISMLVASRDNEVVSLDTVLLLLEMLLDGFATEFRLFLWDKVRYGGEVAPPPEGFFERSTDVPIMTNLGTIPLLLNISYFCSENLQCCLLNTLYNCVGGSSNISLTNLSTCLQMKPPIFDMLMDVFPNLTASAQRAAAKLLQVVGRHTVTVAQLKRIFRMLHLQDGKRPDYTLTLLDAMEGMIVTAQVPRQFFFFQGNESGLRLPAFKKWPAMKGFSFSTWFCIDSPKSQTGKGDIRESFAPTRGDRANLKYNPRLLCFRQDSGFGFELYFKAHDSFPNAFSVMFTVFASSGAHTVEIGVVARSRGKGQGWHHIALAHTASNFRSKSELLVLINSKRSQHTITYPRFSDEVRYPTIGDVSPNFRDEGSITTFFGQVAPIYFFSESLPEVYLQGIYELGPNYSQLFSDKDNSTQSFDSSVQRGPNFARVQDGFLSAAIMLTYNPALRRGNVIIDNTPEKNVNLWRPSRFTEEFCEQGESPMQDLLETGGTEDNSAADAGRRMNAMRLRGTYVFSTRDVRDSFDCLGGVKVLLPLFTQLHNAVDQIRASDDVQLQTEIYFKILKLHCSFLRGTPENLRLMDQFKFNLLSHFMEILGPQYLTVQVLRELIRWSESLHWNEEWQNDFIREILCNFKLWKFSSFAVQRDLFDYVQSMTLSNPDRMYSVVTIPALIDALYLFYGNAPDLTCRPTSAKSKAEEGLVLQEWKMHCSLEPTELRRLRAVLVNMIYVMISTTANPIEDDIALLLNYLTLETSPNHIVDVLKILLQMINVDRPDLGTRVMLAFISKNGINHFLQLLQHSNARVRMYALVCFCSVIHFAVVHGKLPAHPAVSVAAEKPPPAAAARGTLLSVRVDESLISDADIPSIPSTPRTGVSAALNRSTYSMKSEAASVPAPEAEASRDEHSRGSQDTFEALGIPAPSLTGLFLWIQQKLKAAMKNDVHSKEAAERQCYIIFTALCLTMFGLPAKKLVVQIENMYGAMVDADSAEGGERRLSLHISPSMSQLQEISSASILDREEHSIDQEFDFDTASWRICVPMILPALISLIQIETINSLVRIRLLLRLKGCVNNIDNFDIVLGIPNWQAYIFNCLALEQSRIDFLDAYKEKCADLSPVSAQRLEEVEKESYESQNIIDVLISFMSDIHIHSIQFGSPSTAYFTINRPREVRDLQFHSMATKDLLELMKKDNRKVGCIGEFG